MVFTSYKNTQISSFILPPSFLLLHYHLRYHRIRRRKPDIICARDEFGEIELINTLHKKDAL